MRNRLTALLLMGMTWMLASLPAHAASEWDTYKSRFLMSDGRIIDTGNNSVSHTEGQGFAMMMAVENNDRASFDKIWGWTNATLRNPKNGLFYWRYNPVEPDPIRRQKQRHRRRYVYRLGAAQSGAKMAQ
ncbi:Endoglucanase precursor [Cedecea neteri]|uniref:cellulase n=1 Tax=Cedecea neteri TaxID=158822 RepID=A0A2X2T2T8_9ENTR|nr:Endoglucanase precursor [Cedecea neteri]